MKKGELVQRIAKKLREQHTRKPVTMPRHTFHVSDDSGASCDFVVSPSKGLVQYTTDDVDKVFTAMLEVICEALMKGENIQIHGYGSLGVRYIKPHPMRVPSSDEWIDVPGKYAPRVSVGKFLKNACDEYGIALKDKVENGAFISEEDLEKYMNEINAQSEPSIDDEEDDFEQVDGDDDGDDS